MEAKQDCRLLTLFDIVPAAWVMAEAFQLDNMAVVASACGKGIASKLIRPILENADAQGVIAYTDTATCANEGLYE